VVLHILQLSFIKPLQHLNGGSGIHWLRLKYSLEIFLPFCESLYAYKQLTILTAVGKLILLIILLHPIILALGTDDDWARIPLTPMAAQVIADSFHCFLPTRKMVNDIYEQAA
jgi:hypothetical protein